MYGTPAIEFPPLCLTFVARKVGWDLRSGIDSTMFRVLGISFHFNWRENFCKHVGNFGNFFFFFKNASGQEEPNYSNVERFVRALTPSTVFSTRTPDSVCKGLLWPI